MSVILKALSVGMFVIALRGFFLLLYEGRWVRSAIAAVLCAIPIYMAVFF